MTKYQVAVIARPQDWAPASLDDVPPAPGPVLRVTSTTDTLFDAVRATIEHNTAAGGQWAVVVDPELAGRAWPEARLVTPIAYKIAAIWWPEGWEPSSPCDVPNCVWKAHGDPPTPAEGYRNAESTILALNRQCMDQTGTTWYVMVAVENEPVSETLSFDAAGAETTTIVRRLHVLRPEPGTHGNCAHCPAHTFPCVQADWSSQVQAITAGQGQLLRQARG